MLLAWLGAVCLVKNLANELLKLNGVVGYSDPRDSLVIYVESEKYAQAVPTVFAGYPVKVVVIGKVVAYGIRTEKVRPVVGGISIGDPSVTAGTLGCIDAKGNLLTNAHVIAINWKTGGWNKPGTPVLQPGPYDGGTLKDKIGVYEKHIPIRFNDVHAENYADAACGKLEADGRKLTVLGKNGEILVGGTAEVKKGQVIYKSGRTTGLTANTVMDTHATIKVYGYPQGWAVFRDLILVKQPFDAPGDSGSLAFDDRGRVVGLVFAGSKVVGVVCKVEYLSQLGVDFGSPPPAPPKLPKVPALPSLPSWSVGAAGVVTMFALPAIVIGTEEVEKSKA